MWITFMATPIALQLTGHVALPRCEMVVHMRLPDRHELAERVIALSRDLAVKWSIEMRGAVTGLAQDLEGRLLSGTFVPWNVAALGEMIEYASPIGFSKEPDLASYMRMWWRWRNDSGRDRTFLSPDMRAILYVSKLHPIYRISDLSEAIERAETHGIKDLGRLGEEDRVALADILIDDGLGALTSCHVVAGSEIYGAFKHMVGLGVHIVNAWWDEAHVAGKVDSPCEGFVWPSMDMREYYRDLVVLGPRATIAVEGWDGVSRYFDEETYMSGDAPLDVLRIQRRIRRGERINFHEFERLIYHGERAYPEPRQTDDILFTTVHDAIRAHPAS